MSVTPHMNIGNLNPNKYDCEQFHLTALHRVGYQSVMMPMVVQELDSAISMAPCVGPIQMPVRLWMINFKLAKATASEFM